MATKESLSARATQIVDAARQLLEKEGQQALSMRRLAELVGIKAPSIYKHFASKDALEAALISKGFEEQAVLFEAELASMPRANAGVEDEGAGRSSDALHTLARSYRDYARRHPQLYRLMTERALNRELLAPGAEERAAAPVIAAAGGDEDLARATWAFAHGMTILELGERFPPGADLDAAWRRGIDALAQQAIRTAAAPPASRRARP